MLIDWHTNLWLDEHLDEHHRNDMNVRSGGRMTNASPSRHEIEVAGVADKFAVVAIRWPRLGVDVPNDFVADYVARFPGRAVGFACIDPREPGAGDELERAIKTRGLHGLKLGPTYQGFDPWSKEAWQLYEIANDLRIPILWHQASAFPSQSVLEYGRPYLVDKVARAFPEMPMILAHFGKPWTLEVVHMLRKHKQIFTDISAIVYRGWEFYDAMLRAQDYGVMGQVLFGSDFPVQTTNETLASLRKASAAFPGMPRISDETIEDIITNRPFELVWRRDPFGAR